MDEFELIHRYFTALTPAAADVHLGIGDDAALLSVPSGQELVVSTDTLVAGRHFPLDSTPGDIGWKALAVNLSDLAAMGAEPRWFTLALTLERADEVWLSAFAQGMGQLARQHGIALVGGDTTRGPLSLTLTAMGVVPAGQALRRDGARVGDSICVTGTLGDAALALALRRDAGGGDAFLRERLDRPRPRVVSGLRLRGLANAAIDLSDGLAGDLSHVLRASAVGARIEAQRLPASPSLLDCLRPGMSRLALQVHGGDDYELCICIPPDRVERARLDIPLTAIGTITAEPDLRFVDATGATIVVPPHGYRHFE